MFPCNTLAIVTTATRSTHITIVRQMADDLPIVMTSYILYNYLIARNLHMSKEAVFTMKLEPELRAEFMAEAEAAHRPASQVLRELMREFVQRQREAREYDKFLQRKVKIARSSMRAGRGRLNTEVEAEFAARRASAANNA